MRRTKRPAPRTLATLKTSATKLIARTQARTLANVRSARNVAVARAAIARARTVKAVGQLEHAFEKRVSQAAARLGVPTAKEVRALARQVAQLQASVERLRRSRSRARA